MSLDKMELRNFYNFSKLAAIIPHISEEIICFYLIILPTIEDIRDF